MTQGTYYFTNRLTALLTDSFYRFVLLPDCGHSIEVKGMDGWMSVEANNGEIVKKCCPRCRTPIRDCPRYGNVIKAIFNDIVMVKRKLFNMRGNPAAFFKQANASLESATLLLHKLKIKHRLFTTLGQNLNSIRLLLAPKMVKGKSVNPSHDPSRRYFIQVKLDFISRALQLFKTESALDIKRRRMKEIFPDEDLTDDDLLGMRMMEGTPVKKTPEMNADLQSKLCDVVLKLTDLLHNRESIMEEDYLDIFRELERLDLVKTHFLLQSTGPFASVGATSAEQVLLDRELTKNVRVLNEEQTASIKAALKALAKILDTGIGVSDAERMQIIQAMGMSQGHWFKCPNGHIYAITECGGAMEQSKCNECGAEIGGGNHRLLGDNQLASEMDGAVRPAWPG